jgi:hypothetical protein
LTRNGPRRGKPYGLPRNLWRSGRLRKPRPAQGQGQAQVILGGVEPVQQAPGRRTSSWPSRHVRNAPQPDSCAAANCKPIRSPRQPARERTAGVIARNRSLAFLRIDSADQHVFPRQPTIPQHDRVGFVGGDALDHAAPTSRRLFERGCCACGELYRVPSLDSSVPSLFVLAVGHAAGGPAPRLDPDRSGCSAGDDRRQEVDDLPDADHRKREVHLIKGMGTHLLAPHCEVAGMALPRSTLIWIGARRRRVSPLDRGSLD